MQLRERMARTSWESLTLTAAGVAATGEDLGDAATVLLPGANDIPDQRRDVDIVRGGEAAEEERQRVGAHGEAAKERHGRSWSEDG
ncbi:Os10g0475700 [Oryza sativa Japonica Group]|uniref:Os10g0475700 protein n=1 Tax=Oryza sativa subsp. japonica TaxID=39947 RepID=A0A0P0XVA6_ORYSJ|nr:Os10g0475700 [Oryza sativa Japonica Group]